eukprot:3920455-Prymnesium_polylepis.1
MTFDAGQPSSIGGGGGGGGGASPTGMGAIHLLTRPACRSALFHLYTVDGGGIAKKDRLVGRGWIEAAIRQVVVHLQERPVRATNAQGNDVAELIGIVLTVMSRVV